MDKLTQSERETVLAILCDYREILSDREDDEADKEAEEIQTIINKLFP